MAAKKPLMSGTGFWERISRLSQYKTRFFMPGHKGNPAAIPPFASVLPYDITEIAGADDLSCPSDTLAKSEEAMSALYGSGATLYSASGSTACIQAMFTVFVRPHESVVMLRGCHVSAVRALAFLDANPVWVLPCGGQAVPADIAAALAHSRAKTVYITSPTYEGVLSDIAALRRVCDEAGASLLVDNAHGAHLRFISPACHPLALGAHATADSAHKTLPCLTPAAMLHLQDGGLALFAREALNLYSSTSPSYLVLESLDLAAGMLATSPPNFDEAGRALAYAAADVPHITAATHDPLKLNLVPHLGGYCAGEVQFALEQAGILPELADAEHIVLMASPYNTAEDFRLLKKALLAFETPRLPLAPQVTARPFVLPRTACSVRTAVFSQKELLPLAQTPGRIAAQAAAPCPPGILVAVPGEIISDDMLPLLQQGGFSQLYVVK